ncbi:TetR/AcrR family transcriptional regulator [Pseudofrankia inefficax]|uniref:Regulatory protein TetR n=1 Tax=Pseudofrankia inefficax (strain DSM 45817 / CECT 9037 / DDB 130130 / EuI1c) TaxID=298654 RepID=E3IUA7_PSEI1|nr:TetR/AcrR family transcriptional regulator [Pseudofrankia inefficax]ADP82444.1 regulatory protein TetR [Pseudofrankia inefficax]
MPERRRGAVLDEALLDAAWAELMENGYASFTMDAVVQRAGTSRPVLYRRWPDRHELVRAAVTHALDRDRVDIPDTGTLRGDVLTLMREINATRVQLATILSVHLAGYYQETGTSPADLRQFAHDGRRSSVDVLFDRAAARGEIGPEGLSDRLRALPFDLLRHEFLMTLAPVPDQVLVEIVDTIFLPLVLDQDGS